MPINCHKLKHWIKFETEKNNAEIQVFIKLNLHENSTHL